MVPGQCSGCAPRRCVIFRIAQREDVAAAGQCKREENNRFQTHIQEPKINPERQLVRSRTTGCREITSSTDPQASTLSAIERAFDKADTEATPAALVTRMMVAKSLSGGNRRAVTPVIARSNRAYAD